MVLIMIVGALLASVGSGLAQDGFVDHGVGAPVAESRGALAYTDAQGRNMVLILSTDQSERGWVLFVDTATEEWSQLYYPERVPNSPPFASLLSKNGRFYTFAGPTFLELDLNRREWLFHGKPPAPISCVVGTAMVDGPDGRIYAAAYPSTHVVSYDPGTGELRDHGQLDPAEQYPFYLVCDADGWLYAGIGTARQNIVALNPATGERRQLVPEEQRTHGTAVVTLGPDGAAYGQANGVCYRLRGGQAEVVAREQVPAAQPTGALSWGSVVGKFTDGSRVQSLDLPGRWLRVVGPDGATRRVEFDYQSGGASITSLAAGPEGVVYASTCHPMHLLALDTKTMQLRDLGPIPKVGGGNFCAMATLGTQLFGAQYSAGALWAYDVTQPWNPTGKPQTLAITARQLMANGSFERGHFTYLEDLDVVFLKGDEFGSEGSFTLTAPTTGQYYLYVAPLQSERYCTVQFLFDGEPIGSPFNASSATTQPGPLLEFGPLQLTAGEHRLTVRTLPTEGKQPWYSIGSAELTTTRRQSLALRDTTNPRILAQWKNDICRPRTALAHPDGKHVIMGGYADYGFCGGGIGIYNLETNEPLLLTAEKDLLPGHSTITLQALPDGNLVGGTSVSAPGGGHPTATEAELFILDWASKKLVFHTVPVPGDGEIVSIMFGRDGLVYGLSGKSTFFVFDPTRREVVHSESFADYGSVPRHALQLAADGTLYAMMYKAIVRITPGSFEHQQLATPPAGITAGGALVNGLLVYASNAHVWSYQLPQR